jgi:hypothetical protein
MKALMFLMAALTLTQMAIASDGDSPGYCDCTCTADHLFPEGSAYSYFGTESQCQYTRSQMCGVNDPEPGDTNQDVYWDCMFTSDDDLLMTRGEIKN